MKKKISIITAALLLFTLILSLTVSAAGEISAFVTISDENGKTVLALAKVAVSDFDGDGILTVSDALYSAHESFYDGGAKAGYACSESEYGLSLDKLWGCENGGGYGYYVNDTASMSLADEIKDGDRVNAFVYTDTVTYSDTYSYFDIQRKSVEAGETVLLVLMYAGYDDNWNPVSLPVSGAEITVNGASSGVFTDENGKAAISFDGAGEYTVSANSDSITLVPPVCIIDVIAVSEATANDTETSGEDAPATSAVSTEAGTAPVSDTVSAPVNENSAQTGDVSVIITFVLALSGIASAITVLKRKNAGR